MTTHVRCLFCCLPHSDLDNCLGICYQRVSLDPARGLEVKANCFDVGVSSGDATEILSCLIVAIASMVEMRGWASTGPGDNHAFKPYAS